MLASKVVYDSNGAASSKHMLLQCGLECAVTKKIATWLILPVVIRSSQRLSHACLSINLLL
jgi:hypothetical protein